MMACVLSVGTSNNDEKARGFSFEVKLGLCDIRATTTFNWEGSFLGICLPKVDFAG